MDASWFLREALEWCLRLSGGRRVVLWQVDPAADRLVALNGVGGPRPEPQPAARNPLFWVAREGVSLRLDPRPAWSDAQQVIAAPVRSLSDRAHVATFEVDEATPLQATQFDGLAVYLGGMLSVDHERRLLGEQHARADDLIRVLRALPAATDAAALHEQLARAAHDLVGGTGCAISLWEHERGVVAAAEGDAPAAGTPFGASESETALAARVGSVLTRGHGTLGRLPLVAPGERIASNPRALVAVPLKIGLDVIGVITAWSADDFSVHRLRDLETLAHYAALQLRHAREFGVMRELAQHDSLTGLSNRLAFERFLADESARYERYQRPFAVVMVDIDHFKDVNDRYGHEAGDRVLKQVSEAIRGSLRAVDFCGRIGGEEFVAVLPETGLQKAVEIAERIRTRVETLEVDWQAQRIRPKVSAGVSAIPECVGQASQLLRSADAALYTAKREGRNRVIASRTGDRGSARPGEGG